MTGIPFSRVARSRTSLMKRANAIAEKHDEMKGKITGRNSKAYLDKHRNPVIYLRPIRDAKRRAFTRNSKGVWEPNLAVLTILNAMMRAPRQEIASSVRALGMSRL